MEQTVVNGAICDMLHGEDIMVASLSAQGECQTVSHIPFLLVVQV